MSKISKKIIESLLGNARFSYGYEYRTRKTIIVNEHSWKHVISLLEAGTVPYTIIRVAKSPCTGEISFNSNIQPTDSTKKLAVDVPTPVSEIKESEPIVEKICRACGEQVTMKNTVRCLMRHQGKYVRGFAMYEPVHECPKCGERQ